MPCEVCGEPVQYTAEVAGETVELCGRDAALVSARGVEGLRDRAKMADRGDQANELIADLPPATQQVPIHRVAQRPTRSGEPASLEKDPRLARAERDYLAGRMDGTPRPSQQAERDQMLREALRELEEQERQRPEAEREF
jgi:hypothetical protein